MRTAVASVVIETTPGAAPRVAARLGRLPGVELHGSDGDRLLAAVLAGRDCSALGALAERVVAEHAEVVDLVPAYVADERRYPRTAPAAGPALRVIPAGR